MLRHQSYKGEENEAHAINPHNKHPYKRQEIDLKMISNQQKQSYELPEDEISALIHNRRYKRQEEINQPPAVEALKGNDPSSFITSEEKRKRLEVKESDLISYTDENSGELFNITSTSVALRSQPYQCLYAVNYVRQLHNTSKVIVYTHYTHLVECGMFYAISLVSHDVIFFYQPMG